MNTGLNIRSTVTLNNGVEMPLLGLGVFRSPEGGPLESAIEFALERGYRSFDTASVYQNEKGVGHAIKHSGFSRAELFITTKLWNNNHGYENTIKAFHSSLKKLDTDYIDLYLIHWPVPGKFKESWKALEYLYKEGKVRAIGVSNFLIHHLKELLREASVIPAINQIEFHPYLTQTDLIEFCVQQGIQAEAWSPLMKGRVAHIPVLMEIGQKYRKSPFQVVLRWNIQKGLVTIPKSVKPERIFENSNIFNFELSDEDMLAIDALDQHSRIGPNPDDFSF